MEPSDRGKDKRPRRSDRFRRRSSSRRQLAVFLSILGGLAIIVPVFYLVRTAGSSARPLPRTGSTFRSGLKAPPPPQPKPATRAEPLDLADLPRRTTPRERHRPTGPLYGEALRDAIDKAYHAAKRRADLYAGQSRWGDAIDAMEQVADRYDDEELWLRCEPEIKQLRQRARAAFDARKAEAERFAQSKSYDQARKVLEGIVATFRREEFVVPARERIKELTDQEEAEAAARFVRLITPIEATLPNWEFRKALAEMEALEFRREKFKKHQAERVARLRFLIAMQKKMIQRVVLARPYLTKRSLRVGGLKGDVIDATHEFVTTETERGQDKLTWVKFGPEAAMRLALLTGDPEKASHRLDVARFLMEVGHLRRAKTQLAKAAELGAHTAADEAELARREQLAADNPQ